jgi:hypothetical protein
MRWFGEIDVQRDSVAPSESLPFYPFTLDLFLSLSIQISSLRFRALRLGNSKSTYGRRMSTSSEPPFLFYSFPSRTNMASASPRDTGGLSTLVYSQEEVSTRRPISDVRSTSSTFFDSIPQLEQDIQVYSDLSEVALESLDHRVGAELGGMGWDWIEEGNGRE